MKITQKMYYSSEISDQFDKAELVYTLQGY